MTFSQVMSQCLETIQASSKGVHAAIQLQNNSLMIACGDCNVFVFRYEKGRFIEKSRAQTAKTPHTIGYDTLRQQIYVGGAFGNVDVYQVTDDVLTFVRNMKWSKREIAHITYRMDSDVVMSTGFDGIFTIYSPKHDKVLSATELLKDPIRYIRYDDVGGKIYLGTHAGGIPVFRCEEPEKGDVPEYCYILAGENAQLSHSEPVRCILMDMRTRYMFSCDHAGKILVWHPGAAGLESEKNALGSLDGHLGSKLRAMCWIHDMKALVSAGENGRILVHNVGQHKTCGNWQAHQDELMGVDEVAFGEQGHHIMSWAKDGKLCIWRLNFKLD